MGRTERKLKKKTRLERMEVYINRLSQFNANAMHEVGKLSQGLRYYADGSVWSGRVLPGTGGMVEEEKLVVWTGKTDGPEVARKVLTSLGLPWDKFPTKGGAPADPEQTGRESVLKSLGEEMKKEKEGKEEDDRSEYGRYPGAEEEHGKLSSEVAREAVGEQADGDPPPGVPAKSPGMGEE